MPKKILTLFVILMAMGVLSVFLFFKARPSVRASNPFKEGDSAKINKIELENSSGQTTLELVKAVWQVGAPVMDNADTPTVERLLEGLKEFSVGSILSENKEKHKQFGLEKDSVTKLRVFISGKPEPALEALIGKQGNSFNESYFRFENKDSVYLAIDLPTYLFRKKPDEFRQQKVFSLNFQEATGIKVEAQKRNINLVRSSQTWNNVATGQVLDNTWISGLTSKLDQWRSTEFAKGDETPQTLGFEKPFLKVMVQVSSSTFIATVGNKVPNQDPKAPINRYAQTEGRKSVFFLSSPLADEAVNYLTTSSWR